MINDDTFPALADIWTEYTEEVTASLDRHMDRMDDILDAAVRGDMAQADAKKAARRSSDIHEDRRGFLRRYYAGKLSDELAAWRAA